MLVDAFKQNRQHGRSVVVFQFCLREFAQVSKEFRGKVEDVMDVFDELCVNSLWAIETYANPFFLDGQKIEGQVSVMFNMAVRVPLYEDGGKPVLRWQKDADGQKVGDAPSVPIQPEYKLVVEGRNIDLVPL